ncbi:uncharacterized protein LOC132195909 [Neocloeon triangulifer]|uniref:uncharacterized protein LOC132195909 n=1 Tax=Neocloeon triangulifer TaxID=2078957 RepID=UPI00286F9EFA|nr:uncharacterized protein LOC132195909 [Neocloeon triangulifer]
MRATFVLLGLLALQGGCGALKEARLVTRPGSGVVRRGAAVTLVCEYDLEGAPLYSVKWYRGTREFFRHTPVESPSTKLFPFAGLNIDEKESDGNKVRLVDVGFNVAGNYSCEVSADAPSFSTAFVSHYITVVALPEKRPLLTVERPDYEVGNVLRANCSAGPSRPAANLTFYINDMPVGAEEVRSRVTTDGTEAAQAGLALKLRPFHFNAQSRVVVRCDATILGVYAETAKVVVRSRIDAPPFSRDGPVSSAAAVEPKPERVTSPNRTGSALVVSGPFWRASLVLWVAAVLVVCS